jgi:chorismate mutase / prephenate dehydratase
MTLDHPAHTLSVAYLGPAGTFTHAAARAAFGLGSRLRDTTTIDGVFDLVRRREVDYGVTPIENSTEGSVTNTVDALIDNDVVVIRRELLLDVRHCLISLATDLSGVTRVYSHPQALAQCRAWLADNLAGAEHVPTASTAAAAREAARDEGAAAIGGRLAAELCSVPILRDDVHDVAGNATRFVVLATTDAPCTGHDKTSVVFAIHDARGALRRVLEVFDDHGINLSRIESRPSRQKAWDYVFLADLEGHRDDDNVRDALAILAARCPMLRTLGSYPRCR